MTKPPPTVSDRLPAKPWLNHPIHIQVHNFAVMNKHALAVSGSRGPSTHLPGNDGVHSGTAIADHKDEFRCRENFSKVRSRLERQRILIAQPRRGVAVFRYNLQAESRNRRIQNLQPKKKVSLFRHSVHTFLSASIWTNYTWWNLSKPTLIKRNCLAQSEWHWFDLFPTRAPSFSNLTRLSNHCPWISKTGNQNLTGKFYQIEREKIRNVIWFFFLLKTSISVANIFFPIFLTSKGLIIWFVSQTSKRVRNRWVDELGSAFSSKISLSKFDSLKKKILRFKSLLFNWYLNLSDN